MLKFLEGSPNINHLAEIKRHVALSLVLVDISCEVHCGDLHLGAGHRAHTVTRIPVHVVQLRCLLARVRQTNCCIGGLFPLRL